MINLLTLSLKQMELINQVESINRENEEIEDENMKQIDSLKNPKILSPDNKYFTINYEDYLKSCKAHRAKTLEREFNLDPFNDAFVEISNNEILLFRKQLEDTLQTGLHALIQIQFLDSFVILRRDESVPKLVFNPEKLENITFFMDTLVKFHSIDPPTVANEIYENEKIKATNDMNLNLSYMSPEMINATLMNIRLNALSFGLAQQHKCRIERILKTGDFFCHGQSSEDHKLPWIYQKRK